MSHTLTDRPGVHPADFSASLIETPGLPHNLTVRGKATGDYRISDIRLVPASRQHNNHVLVLDIEAKVGPVQDPHPDLIRVFPVQYDEHPAHHNYTGVEIVNGPQRFTVRVIDAL